MDYQIIALVITLVVFISYVSFIWFKYGVLSSISDSYYQLPGNWKILFTLFTWGFGLPAIIAGSCSLMFFAGASIMLCGTAGMFHEPDVKNIHIAGAALAVFFSQLSIALQWHLYFINIIFLISGLLIIIIPGVKNRVWWLEIAAFSAIGIALGINLL